MAYVASWHAPQGDVVGAKNMEAVPHNQDNYQQTLVQNETVGYYKPPFCQWPFGGYSKKEAKYRHVNGEPVVKAGSFEKDGNDFYFRAPGKFENRHDGDGDSVCTNSTTLYIQSNLCTRTYGPHKKAAKFPLVDDPNCLEPYMHKDQRGKQSFVPKGKRQPSFVRPTFDRLRDRLEVDVSSEMRARHSNATVDIWKMRGTGGAGNRSRSVSDARDLFISQQRRNQQMAKLEGKDIKPTDPRSLEECVAEREEQERNPGAGREAHERRLLKMSMGARLANPAVRQYKAGQVPRKDARLEYISQWAVPSWREDFLKKREEFERSRTLASPRLYLNKSILAEERYQKAERSLDEMAAPLTAGETFEDPEFESNGEQGLVL